MCKVDMLFGCKLQPTNVQIVVNYPSYPAFPEDLYEVLVVLDAYVDVVAESSLPPGYPVSPARQLDG